MAMALLAWAAAHAAAPEAPIPTASAPSSVQGWLRLIGQGASSASYDGVVMTASAGRSSTVLVNRRHFAGEVQESMESLDGPERQVFRHGNQVRVLWPERRVGLMRQWHEGALSSGPKTWAHLDERVLDFYEVAVIGRQRWAGQQAAVLQFQPRDEFRYGQRLWVHERQGLVLRSETLARQGGQVLEWVAFTQVTLKPQAAQVKLPEPTDMADWRWIRDQVKATSLQEEGWQVNNLPPGFQLMGCVRRSGQLTGRVGADTVQALFSDGVGHVSVFIERFDPRSHARELLLLQGATQVLQRRLGNWWLTVVGDVPAPAVQRFGAAFSRQ